VPSGPLGGWGQQTKDIDRVPRGGNPRGSTPIVTKPTRASTKKPARPPADKQRCEGILERLTALGYQEVLAYKRQRDAHPNELMGDPFMLAKLRPVGDLIAVWNRGGCNSHFPGKVPGRL
jgi:hypothetical protein